MARVYANIFCAIWDDADFCALSSDAQRTYFMLVTQPDITACGLLPLTMRRWSQTVASGDRASLPAALIELEDARFVLVDEDTEELLVRSFAKHDGGYKHAKRLLAVLAYAKSIRSARLRNAVADELRKLDVPGADEVAIDCEPIPNEVAIDRQSVANEVAIGSRRVVVTEVGMDHNPEPESFSLGASAPARPKRATRLADDWKPSAALVEWQRGQGISDFLARQELPKFVDYWKAKGGQAGTKLDWDATWRNWLRTAQERSPQAPKAAAGGEYTPW